MIQFARRVAITLIFLLPIPAFAAVFLSLGPNTDSVVTTPTINLVGTSDEAGAVVTIWQTETNQFSSASVDALERAFSAPLTLAIGVNTIDVTVLSRKHRGGDQRTLRIIYRPDASAIALLSPADGATVADTAVQVFGAFDGPANTGITVNGVIAARDNKYFYAQVPLQTGGNRLSVNATLPTGQVLTRTLDVIGGEPEPLHVYASGNNGLAPLQVDFGIQNNGGNPLIKVEVDFNGDGVTDLTTADAAAALAYTYAAAGAYRAHFTLTDSQHKVTEKTVMVTAQDPAQLDRLLRAQWGGLQTALLRADKAQALPYSTRRRKSNTGRYLKPCKANYRPSPPALPTRRCRNYRAASANTASSAPWRTAMLACFLFISPSMRTGCGRLMRCDAQVECACSILNG